MKKIVITFFTASLLLGCATKDKSNSASGDADSVATPGPVVNPTPTPSTADEANMTTIEWIDPVNKDLGDLTKNQEIEITYRFKNTGDKPLVIETVTAACGCTIPEKPEQPFAPGEEGVIRAKFNGVGSGVISKNVTVTANTKPAKTHTLIFTGNLK